MILQNINPFPFAQSGVTPEVGLLAYCECTDTAALNTWETGTGFQSNTNPTFAATDTGFGLNSNNASYSDVTTDANVKSMFVDGAFTVEYRIHYTQFSITAGVISDANISVPFHVMNTAATIRIQDLHRASYGGIRFLLVANGVTITMTASTGVDVSVNGYLTWRIVHDTSGIDGGANTCAVYVDKEAGAGFNLVASSTTAINIDLNTTALTPTFRLGSATNAGGTQYMRGVIDYFKTYNYAKTS